MNPSHEQIPKMIRTLQSYRANKNELELIQQKAKLIEQLNVKLVNEIAEMFGKNGGDWTDTAIIDMANSYLGMQIITHYDAGANYLRINLKGKEERQ